MDPPASSDSPGSPGGTYAAPVLETTLAVLAPAVFLVRLLPQPLKLARTGVDDGVSPLAAFNQVVAEGAWLTYGLVQANVPIWLVSAVALFPSGWQALLLVRRSRPSDLFWAGCFGAVVAAAWATDLLGPLLGASVLLTTGPQVLAALREDDLSGIATSTWRLALVDAALWGAYGLVLADWALVGYWAVLSACAITVLARVRSTRTVGALPPARTPELGGNTTA